MIKVKEKTWDDVTILQYRHICDIAKDKDTDDITKDVELIGLLFDVDEKSVWDMPVDEVSQYKQAISFLSTTPNAGAMKLDRVYINEKPYKVCVDLNSFTYAQYVDFQQYWVKDDNLTDILSVLLVPEGEKYGSGYDIEELKKDIEKYVSMTTATAVSAFFLTSLVRLLEHSLRYLEKKTKIAKSLPIKKTQKEREAIAEAMRQVKEIKSILGLVSSKKSQTSPS